MTLPLPSNPGDLHLEDETYYVSDGVKWIKLHNHLVFHIETSRTLSAERVAEYMKALHDLLGLEGDRVRLVYVEQDYQKGAQIS